MNLGNNIYMGKKIIIGIIAGFVSGFFSTGGGMILVPAFIYLLNKDDKEARATSVICILPMVIVSGIFYYQNQYIDWRIGLLSAMGGMIGGYIGARLLRKINEKYLKIAFIFFLLYTSIKFIF